MVVISSSERILVMTTPSNYQLHVTGMSCQHCVKAVTQAVQDQDGEALVTVDLAQGQVTVQTVLGEDAVREIIREEGYGVA